MVDNLQIYINPVNNPDGYVATFNGRRLQRKNMNTTCNVDLNRNYEEAWGAGTSGAPCNSGNYPGTGPFSEPESQAVKRLIESLDRPALFYDYHSTAAQVMIPYAHTTTLPPNYAKNRAWCELYSTTLRGLYGTNYPTRPGFNLGRGQGGGAFDWFRAEFAETMVVELGGGPAFDIGDDQLVPFAEENYLAWLAVAEQVVNENPAKSSDAGAPPPPPDAAPSPPTPPLPPTPPPPPHPAPAPRSRPPCPPPPLHPPPARPHPHQPPRRSCHREPAPPRPTPARPCSRCNRSTTSKAAASAPSIARRPRAAAPPSPPPRSSSSPFFSAAAADPVTVRLRPWASPAGADLTGSKADIMMSTCEPP